MAMSRDQLRAARILLHLKQPELAAKAKMGVATLRRYEGGQEVGELYADSLRRVIEGMGIVFLEDPEVTSGGTGEGVQDDTTPKVLPKLGVGVALRPHGELPDETKGRLLHASQGRPFSKGTKKDPGSPPAEATGAQPPKGAGRPKKAQEAAGEETRAAGPPPTSPVKKADEAVGHRGRPKKGGDER